MHVSALCWRGVVWYGMNTIITNHQLWPAFVPACLSLACGCYLLVFKASVDVLRPKQTRATAMMDHIMREDGGVDRRPLLGETTEIDDEFIAYSAPTS